MDKIKETGVLWFWKRNAKPVRVKIPPNPPQFLLENRGGLGYFCRIVAYRGCKGLIRAWGVETAYPLNKESQINKD